MKALIDRYWIFAGENYYPSGGIEDWKDSYEELEEAKTGLKNIMENPDQRYNICSRYDWGYIVDMEHGDIIFEASFNSKKVVHKEYSNMEYTYVTRDVK